jgi:hypothetical protein
MLAPSLDDRHNLWIQVFFGTSLSPLRMPGTDAEGNRLLATTPPWAPPGTFALARASHGVSWMVSVGTGVDVSAFATDDAPLFSRYISIDDMEPQLRAPLPIHARPEGAYFAVGDWLFCVDEQESIELQLRGTDEQATWTWRTVESSTYDRVLALAKEDMKPGEIAAELQINKSTVLLSAGQLANMARISIAARRAISVLVDAQELEDLALEVGELGVEDLDRQSLVDERVALGEAE